MGSDATMAVLDKFPEPHMFLARRLHYLESLLENPDDDDSLLVDIRHCVWALSNCAATKEMAHSMAD